MLGAVERPGYITHVDGYAAQSVLARIRDEREGAGQGFTVTQRVYEVYRGDGLDVQRAIQGMPEGPLRVLNWQYVPDPQWEVRISFKARACETSRAGYFQLLALGEMWLLSRLDPAALEAAASLDSQPVDPPRRELQTPNFSRIQPTQSSHDGQVSLEALRRPTISMRARPAVEPSWQLQSLSSSSS